MPTNPKQLQFLQLSEKEQLDAAFNAGARDMEEARQLVEAGKAQAAQQYPQATPVQPQTQGGGGLGGFFNNVNQRLQNLSPEQAQGLLAFGTQLLQGVQPGQTAGGTLGQAIQTGLATTANMREQARQRQLEAEKQRMAMAEAIRKQRETRVKEGQLGLAVERFGLDRERFDFEQSPEGRLGNINPSSFEPTSLARYLETGNLGDLQLKPQGSLVNVNVGQQGPEGNIPLSQTQINREQDRLSQGLKRLDDMQDIKEKVKNDYLTYWARAKNAFGSVIDRAGLAEVDPTGYADFSANMQAAMLPVELLFQDYRQEITGAAAVENEINQLRQDIISGNIGPEAFSKRMDALIDRMERDIRGAQKNLTQGLPSTLEEAEDLGEFSAEDF